MRRDFQVELRFLRITSSPAFVRAPEGNGVAERFIRTLKEQLLWVRTFQTVEDLRLALHNWLRLYNEQWYVVNRKRVQRLMRLMSLAGMAPGPSTSGTHPGHQVYPYLLRGIEVSRPNQVWSTDITYIRLARGFVYLVAIIDWYSRRVLAWRISNSLDTSFCVDCLEDALRCVGKPADIFNSDQGSQFTSAVFTDVLKREGIAISMDGRGRALDNIFVERLWRSVKYEEVYLKDYGTVTELTRGLADYFAFYNGERPHQSLDNRTPNTVYADGQGGGARIPDHVGVRTGQRCFAAIETMGVA